MYEGGGRGDTDFLVSTSSKKKIGRTRYLQSTPYPPLPHPWPMSHEILKMTGDSSGPSQVSDQKGFMDETQEIQIEIFSFNGLNHFLT